MNKLNKTICVLLSLCASLAVVFAGCVNAFALGSAPITANESIRTIIIFAIVVALAAIAGIIYFIIQRKNRK